MEKSIILKMEKAITLSLQEYEKLKSELEILKQKKIFVIANIHESASARMVTEYKAYNSTTEIVRKIQEDCLERIEDNKKEESLTWLKSDHNINNWKIIGFKWRKK